MMEVSKQVCSLEHAKKLKELGVKQESLFWWYFCQPKENKEPYWAIMYSTYGSMPDRYSAFTAAELFEIVPSYISGTMPEIIKGHSIADTKLKYCARYWDQGIIPDSDENMANAVANLLIYLIEQSIIGVPK